MQVDGRPIRDKARKDYKKALRELERARTEIEQFEKIDRPQFQQWLNRSCGALITEIRETTQKYQVQRTLLFEVQSEALLSECSYQRAYEKVMRRQAKGAKPDGSDEATDGGQEGSDRDNPFADFFSDATNQAGFSEPTSQAPAAIPQLKELYRALVRRLHPDTQGTMTPQRKDWWHQAQAAYERGDAEQLQLLLTLCEIDDHGTTNRTSVSLLMRITREFKNSFHTLKTRLAQFKRDPAWHFSVVQDRGPLLEKAEGLLRTELFELKRGLAAVDAQLESWAHQPHRGPASRRRGHFHTRPEDAW